MTIPTPRSVLAALALMLTGACNTPQSASNMSEPMQEGIAIQYLEIVTPEVDAPCAALEKMHGVTFSEPDMGFGNARKAALRGGGMIGVRGPMRPDEAPVVRPYLLVEDIDGSVESAQAAGGKVAVPPMEIPGQGKFSIYLLGGIDHGLWKN